jgi:hypothetical protein
VLYCFQSLHVSSSFLSPSISSNIFAVLHLSELSDQLDVTLESSKRGKLTLTWVVTIQSDAINRIQIGMFRLIRVDHTKCLQVAIKTHSGPISFSLRSR